MFSSCSNYLEVQAHLVSLAVAVNAVQPFETQFLMHLNAGFIVGPDLLHDQTVAL